MPKTSQIKIERLKPFTLSPIFVDIQKAIDTNESVRRIKINNKIKKRFK